MLDWQLRDQGALSRARVVVSMLHVLTQRRAHLPAEERCQGGRDGHAEHGAERRRSIHKRCHASALVTRNPRRTHGSVLYNHDGSVCQVARVSGGLRLVKECEHHSSGPPVLSRCFAGLPRSLMQYDPCREETYCSIPLRCRVWKVSGHLAHTADTDGCPEA